MDGARAQPARHLEHLYPDSPCRVHVPGSSRNAVAAYTWIDYHRSALRARRAGDFCGTWANYRYVAPTADLIGAAVIAVILIIAGILLTHRRPSRRPARADLPASRSPDLPAGTIPVDCRHLRRHCRQHPGGRPLDPHRSRKHAHLLGDRGSCLDHDHGVVASPRLGRPADSGTDWRCPLRVRLAHPHEPAGFRFGVHHHCPDQQRRVCSAGADSCLDCSSAHSRKGDRSARSMASGPRRKKRTY